MRAHIINDVEKQEDDRATQTIVVMSARDFERVETLV